MTESGQWSNFLSELGDWWRTVTSLHTLWWVTVWRRKAWKKGRSMGWPYDVVIQRGTCRFLLKITAGPDRNSSSISVVLFLLDASLLEEGGMAGWGCIVLFFIPLSLSKRKGKGSERGSSWNLLSHLCRRPTVVSFTALEFSSWFSVVSPSFRKSAVRFKSGPRLAWLDATLGQVKTALCYTTKSKRVPFVWEGSSQPGKRGFVSQPSVCYTLRK